MRILSEHLLTLHDAARLLPSNRAGNLGDGRRPRWRIPASTVREFGGADGSSQLRRHCSDENHNRKKKTELS